MNADTWTRLQAFRHALELTSCEASLTAGYDHLKDFPVRLQRAGTARR
ncbi:hypothetical protein AB2F45_26015 (plasmid) [Escherichia coli]